MEQKVQKSKDLLPVKRDAIHCIILFSAVRCSLVNMILPVLVKGQRLCSDLTVQGLRSCLGLS